MFCAISVVKELQGARTPADCSRMAVVITVGSSRSNRRLCKWAIRAVENLAPAASGPTAPASSRRPTSLGNPRSMGLLKSI